LRELQGLLAGGEARDPRLKRIEAAIKGVADDSEKFSADKLNAAFSVEGDNEAAWRWLSRSLTPVEWDWQTGAFRDNGLSIRHLDSVGMPTHLSGGAPAFERLGNSVIAKLPTIKHAEIDFDGRYQFDSNEGLGIDWFSQVPRVELFGSGEIENWNQRHGFFSGRVRLGQGQEIFMRDPETIVEVARLGLFGKMAFPDKGGLLGMDSPTSEAIGQIASNKNLCANVETLFISQNSNGTKPAGIIEDVTGVPFKALKQLRFFRVATNRAELRALLRAPMFATVEYSQLWVEGSLTSDQIMTEIIEAIRDQGRKKMKLKAVWVVAGRSALSHAETMRLEDQLTELGVTQFAY
ncbi:MAG: hypothetical protein ABL994_25195, partial [Verrucomicrobiales bacterium]